MTGALAIAAQVADALASVDWRVYAVAMIFAAGVGCGGYWFGSEYGAERVVERVPADTVTRTRTITKRDTVTETVAETIIRYRRDTTRVIDSVLVPVPEDFNWVGAVDRSPLHLTSERARLTYWSPSQRRFVQSVYSVPESSWVLGVEGNVGLAPESLGGSTLLTLTHSKDRYAVSAKAGYGLAATGKVDYGWRAGLTISTTLAEW